MDFLVKKQSILWRSKWLVPWKIELANSRSGSYIHLKLIPIFLKTWIHSPAHQLWINYKAVGNEHCKKSLFLLPDMIPIYFIYSFKRINFLLTDNLKNHAFSLSNSYQLFNKVPFKWLPFCCYKKHFLTHISLLEYSWNFPLAQIPTRAFPCFLQSISWFIDSLSILCEPSFFFHYLIKIIGSPPQDIYTLSIN